MPLLEPNLIHEDGTKVQEARAFKYLGQRKERKGAQTEVNVRIGDANAAWQALKTKIFRNRRLSVQLRIRLYSCLVTSRLLSAAETIPMTKAEEKRMEAMQTTHLRRIHRIPYTLYVPNEPVRRSSKIFSIESRLMEARLRTWSLACRDSPHSFFRATMFGRAADERSSFEKKKQIQYVGLIKTAVSTFSTNAHLQLRDWSLDPELLRRLRQQIRTLWLYQPLVLR